MDCRILLTGCECGTGSKWAARWQLRPFNGTRPVHFSPDKANSFILTLSQEISHGSHQHVQTFHFSRMNDTVSRISVSNLETKHESSYSAPPRLLQNQYRSNSNVSLIFYEISNAAVRAIPAAFNHIFFLIEF